VYGGTKDAVTFSREITISRRGKRGGGWEDGKISPQKGKAGSYRVINASTSKEGNPIPRTKGRENIKERKKG